MVVENTVEYIGKASNGAEVLKNINLPLKGTRDTGSKSLGICGSREREAVVVDLFSLKSR